MPEPESRAHAFAIRSRLAASAEEVWSHAIRLEGVNRELAPLARMTAPRASRTLDLEQLPLGVPAFRSWILAFGILPIDYDDLTLVELERGRRFLERSTLLTQRLWEHERVVSPADAGCVISDRVRFTPRMAILGPLHRVVFRLVFELRHRNLRRIFGGRAMPE
jgi:ligand-binding SRPBCC domain-containing protein